MRLTALLASSSLAAKIVSRFFSPISLLGLESEKIGIE